MKGTIVQRDRLHKIPICRPGNWPYHAAYVAVLGVISHSNTDLLVLLGVRQELTLVLPEL